MNWSTSRKVGSGAAALSALTTLVLGSPSAHAMSAPQSLQVLRVPVNNVVSYTGLGDFTVVGLTNVTLPPNPVLPPNPIRIRATLLRMSVTSVTTGTSCAATGTADFTSTSTTGTFTGIYGIPTDPCRQLLGTLAIRYVVTANESGQLSATAEAVSNGDIITPF